MLKAEGNEVIDCGTYTTDSCDYPDFARKAAELVASGEVDKGIVVCTSGEGVMMTANKVRGVRCGMGYNDEVSALMRQHNNANMIAFSQKFMDLEDVKRRTHIFLNTEFEGGRHLRRVEKIEK
jgi:ribose 5-phosphate isomerase B